MSGGTISTSATKAEALNIQTSVRGACVPWVRGVQKLPGNLLWFNGFKAIPHTEEQGGKGGPTVENTTFTYEASVAMGICAGPIIDVPRVWRGKLSYQGGVNPAQLANVQETWAVPTSGAMQTTLAQAATYLCMVSVTAAGLAQGGAALLAGGLQYTVTAAGVLTVHDEALRGLTLTITYQRRTSSIVRSALNQLGLTLQTGHLRQAVWSGFGPWPAESYGYSGLAFVAATAYQLGDNASVENHVFEVVAPMAYHLGLGVPDVDPALCVRELMLGSSGGGGVPAKYLGTWQRWSDYCVSANLLVSPCLTEQTTAADALEYAARLTNSAIVTSSGRIELVPYADSPESGNGRTYTPNLTPLYDLDLDAFVVNGSEAPLRYKDKGATERYNLWRMEYSARTNEYNTEVAESKDTTDIEARGLQANPNTVDAKSWICDGAVARKAVQLMQQRSVNVLSEYTARLPWHYALADLMDPVTLTEPTLLLDRAPVTIIAIEENEDGDLTFEFEDFPIGSASAPTYAHAEGVGYAPQWAVSPGNCAAPVIFEAPPQRAGTTGVELCVAVRGIAAEWGGAKVWLSLDGTHYQLMGTVIGPSRYGQLAASITSDATSLQVSDMGPADLPQATAAEAEALVTLFLIANDDGSNPEFMAYQGSTLTGAGAYTLTGLVRGAYATPAQAHTVGANFVRFDDRIARSGQLDASMVGKQVHIKCTAFNIYNAAHQSIADVPATTYTITGIPAGYAPGVAGKGLTLNTNALTFTYPKAGGVAPAAITIAASRKGALEGAVTWAVVSGTATLTGSGDERTLTAANLGSDSATIRATITDPVATYTAEVTISKVREGQDGAGNITWTTRGGVVMSGSTATKVSGTDAWNGEAATAQGFAGGCYVSFTAQGTGTFMCGLNADPTSQPDFQTIDRAWTCDISGNCAIYESGTYISGHGAYGSGTTFEVRHSAGFITYYKDGSVVRTTPLADSTVLYADASLYHTGTIVHNLVFGPIGAKGEQGPQGLPGEDGADGANGASAPLLVLLATAQTFAYDSAGAAKPAGQVITFTAALQNVTGSVSFTGRLYNAAGADIGAASLGGSGNSRTLALADFGSAASASITATLGSLTDTTSIVRVQDGANGADGADGANGQDAIVSDLTNDSHTLPATSAGVVTSYAGAATQMIVYRGTSDDSSNWTFSRSNGPNVTSTRSGNIVTVTGLADSVDVGYIDVTATRSGFPAQTKRFTLAKSRSAQGTTGFQAGHYAGVYASASSGTATALGRVKSDGRVLAQLNGGAAVEYSRWWSTLGTPAALFVKATKTAGVASVSGSALGSVIAVSAEPAWSVSRSSTQGLVDAKLLLTYYSDSGGTTVVGIGTLELVAEITF